MADDALAVPQFQLNAVSTLAKLQFEGWKVASEAKLNLAKADLTTAQARLVDMATEDLRQQVKLKQLAVQRYEKELHDLAVEEHKVAVRTAMIDSRAKDTRLFYRFQHLAPQAVSSVWVGFRFFLSLSPTVGQLANTTVISEASRQGDGYCHNRVPAEKCPDVGQEEHTLIDLVEWLLKHSCMPRSGSPASMQLAALGVEFDKATQDTIEAMNKHIAEMREGTFKAWPPMSVAALPLTPAAARAAQPPAQ